MGENPFAIADRGGGPIHQQRRRKKKEERRKKVSKSIGKSKKKKKKIYVLFAELEWVRLGHVTTGCLVAVSHGVMHAKGARDGLSLGRGLVNREQAQILALQKRIKGKGGAIRKLNKGYMGERGKEAAAVAAAAADLHTIIEDPKGEREKEKEKREKMK